VFTKNIYFTEKDQVVEIDEGGDCLSILLSEIAVMQSSLSSFTFFYLLFFSRPVLRFLLSSD